MKCRMSARVGMMVTVERTFALALEASRSIGHHTLALRLADLAAQVRLA